MRRSRLEVKAKSGMAKAYFLSAVAALLGLSASAEKCRQYGCTKYAQSNGYCEQHQPEGKKARAKAAAEEKEIRESLQRLEASRRADAAVAAEYAEATAERDRRRQAQQQKEAEAERAKFEQPLEGLFGKRFGEKQDFGPNPFVPAEPYRKFGHYAAMANGTNGVDMISAYLDFGSDAVLARRELSAVLDDLEAKFERRPNKLFTKEGDEVWALGFGGVKGVAHQQLQVTLAPNGTGYRIVIAAFVIRNPSRTLRRWDPATYQALGAGDAK